ncbi:hypothetical protein [Chelatococcus sambhunathii]
MRTTTHPAASIHRMVMPPRVCPYGTKAIDLLKRRDSRSRTAG